MRLLALALMLAPIGAFASLGTPEAVVAALWRALSHDPGGKADVAALNRILDRDAVILGGRYKDGMPLLERTTVDAFVDAQGRASSEGFYECEVSRLVRTYDRFATVYSVVESRSSRTALKPDFVGVNSIQLYRFGDEWRIVSLYYHLQRHGLPVSLDDGQSGKCIH